MLAGAVGGALFAPAPVGAVAREIIELQRDVALLLQGQRDLQRSLDEKHAIQKTLIEQSLDSVGKLNTNLNGMQKIVQDVQANSGTRIDSMSTQVQGLADNLEEIKARLGKINQQLAEAQSTLQSLDAKVSGGAPAPGPGSTGGSSGATPANPGGAPSSGTPPSADTLYSNGLRDYTGGKYDLARQEFLDYLRYYPETDLASNAQFYLGEILYAQKQYQQAIGEYDKVLQNYPRSFKLAPARLKKGMALVELGQKASAVREFREVVRRFPGTEEERRARAKLRELGATAATR